MIRRGLEVSSMMRDLDKKQEVTSARKMGRGV